MARWTCGVQGFMAKPPLHWWDWCSLCYRQVASSLFYSGILLPMNTYCLLNSTHPLLHCLGYKSHGRCVAEIDITRLFWCWGTTLFFSRLDNLDVNIPILFFLQAMVFHRSLPWQIVHIKIGRSQHGPKTPQVFTAVTSAEPGVRCLGRDANKCRWLPENPMLPSGVSQIVFHDGHPPGPWQSWGSFWCILCKAPLSGRALCRFLVTQKATRVLRVTHLLLRFIPGIGLLCIGQKSPCV